MVLDAPGSFDKLYKIPTFIISQIQSPAMSKDDNHEVGHSSHVPLKPETYSTRLPIPSENGNHEKVKGRHGHGPLQSLKPTKAW